MRTVTAESLLEAVGSVDAAYVEEAELWTGKNRRKAAWRVVKLAAAAACLMLVVTGTALTLQNSDSGGLSGSGQGTETGFDGSAVSGKTTEGAGGEAEAGGIQTSEGHILRIPEEITEVTVVHYSCGKEKRAVLKGDRLEELRAWAEGLILGEGIIFGQGEAPGEESDGGEVYDFQFGEEEFSYHVFGECYIVVGDIWYPVLNPTEPPEP